MLREYLILILNATRQPGTAVVAIGVGDTFDLNIVEPVFISWTEWASFRVGGKCVHQSVRRRLQGASLTALRRYYHPFACRQVLSQLRHGYLLLCAPTMIHEHERWATGLTSIVLMAKRIQKRVNFVLQSTLPYGNVWYET